LLGIDGLIEYSYARDMVIHGQNCKEITGTFAGVMADRYEPPNTYTVDPNYEKYFTYENNSVVYVYAGNGRFDTVADFKAVAGERWRVPFDCNHRLSLTVTDTSSKVINCAPLKEVSSQAKMKFDYKNDTTVFNVVFLEKLFNSGSLFPNLCCEPSVRGIPVTMVELPSGQFFWGLQSRWCPLL
jgi:hypothetical protein